MSAYPPELVDAVAAELARLGGSHPWLAGICESHRMDARRILDILDREGALHRTDETGRPVPAAQ